MIILFFEKNEKLNNWSDTSWRESWPSQQRRGWRTVKRLAALPSVSLWRVTNKSRTSSTMRTSSGLVRLMIEVTIKINIKNIISQERGPFYWNPIEKVVFVWGNTWTSWEVSGLWGTSSLRRTHCGWRGRSTSTAHQQTPSFWHRRGWRTFQGDYKQFCS